MTKARGTSELPKIVYTRSFSTKPANREELEKILHRWELALARKAKAIMSDQDPD